jgi:hypothetical protein
MVEIRDFNGQKHYVAPSAIAKITEAGASSKWHGIRSFVKLFDGTEIESSDTTDSILSAMKGGA